MARKQADFTGADREAYTDATSFIGEGTGKKKRGYTRLDVRKPAPKEYRFTARMPGEYGVYLNEKAYRERTTVTAIIQQLIKADMEAHPEIMEGLDELNAQ
jgi:hypothetical protein